MLKFLLIDNGSIHTTALARLLPEAPEIIRFNSITQIDASQYDCIILSGSSELPLLGNEAAFEAELLVIKNTCLPIIGICFGTELIAHAFGGTLIDLGEKRKGVVDIVSTDNSGLLLEAERHFSVYEAHRFGIKVVPKELIVLAESTHGPEIIKHFSRPIWGLQFHPEHLSESTLGDEIFARILSHSLVRK